MGWSGVLHDSRSMSYTKKTTCKDLLHVGLVLGSVLNIVSHT